MTDSPQRISPAKARRNDATAPYNRGAKSATFASKNATVGPAGYGLQSGGNVPEIAAWLGQLGLGQYAQRFADNEIDVFVLPHLTDHDLRDIGIPLGHRRKILAAIRGLETPSESTASLETPRGSEAERRQVTVM